MPNPNAIVSQVVGLDPPPERATPETVRAAGGITVELEEGRRARLDPADRNALGFAQILASRANRRAPVYLEVDPATSRITRLLLPRVTRIAGVESRADGSLRVQLARSHALHTVAPANPDFALIERSLREAAQRGDLVIFTEDDAHEVVDVRFFRPAPDGPLPGPREPELPPGPWRPDWLPREWIWKWLLLWWRPWRRCISKARAQQVFDAMNATSCAPLTVPAPCIPFLYPDDGCWARAHEMCRLMINMGVYPRKVWIDGNLQAATRNTTWCYVQWGWHVAPTVCVRSWRYYFWPISQEMVIDPSLCTMPVTKAAWKALMTDPAATLTATAWTIYYRPADLDPTFSETNAYLQDFREYLQLRALAEGPPPYAQCPV